jgi:hypothetical protein
MECGDVRSNTVPHVECQINRWVYFSMGSISEHEPFMALCGVEGMEGNMERKQMIVSM